MPINPCQVISHHQSGRRDRTNPPSVLHLPQPPGTGGQVPLSSGVQGPAPGSSSRRQGQGNMVKSRDRTEHETLKCRLSGHSGSQEALPYFCLLQPLWPFLVGKSVGSKNLSAWVLFCFVFLLNLKLFKTESFKIIT